MSTLMAALAACSLAGQRAIDRPARSGRLRAHIMGEPRGPGQRRNRAVRKPMIGWVKVRAR